MGMVIMKYICEEIDNRIYVRGLCCPDYKKVDYSDWIIIESDVDCGGNLINENGQPIWEVVEDKIINNPLPLSDIKIKEKVNIEIKDKIKTELLDKLIEDAINNPDDNNLIKVWINNQIAL